MNNEERHNLELELIGLEKLQLPFVGKLKERRDEIIVQMYNYDTPIIETHNWIHSTSFKNPHTKPGIIRKIGEFQCIDCGIIGDSIIINAEKPFKLHYPYLKCNEMIMKGILQ